MQAFRTLSVTARFLIATTIPGVAAFGAGWAGCGPAIKVEDPELRAIFAKLDRTADSDFRLVCAQSRALTGR